MASAAVAGAAAGMGPFGAFALRFGAGLIDAAIANRLSRDRSVGITPKLLGVPTGSNEPGAPRIWACGQRVRVPCHVLWQSEKIRETVSNAKGSSGIVQRRVFIDCLLAINDRPTREVKQLIGNGKLLLWTSRNLVQVTTSAMSAQEVGGQLVITMADQADPDLSEYFQAGDGIRLSGFVPIGATPNVNQVYWVVDSVTAHTSGATSTLTLDPAEGQVFAGADSSGGTPFSPGTIERIDDAEVGITSATWGVVNVGTVLWNRVQVEGRDDLFTIDDQVTLRGMAYGGVPLFPNNVWRVAVVWPATTPGRAIYTLIRLSGPTWGAPGGASAPVTITNASSL